MLHIAQHSDATRFWAGGNYELNMSFSGLRDRQWPQIMQALWEHPAMRGPLAGRYIPGKTMPANAAMQTPPPTAILIQHGQLIVAPDQAAGCDVQATRSLFECISILVPMGMFAQPNLPLAELDSLLYDIALTLYDLVRFQVAAIGHERACQLASELRTDPELRHNFLVNGNFLIEESILAEIEPDLTPYREVRPGLRHAPARKGSE